MANNLEKQIAAEAREIENAPRVPLIQQSNGWGRCHFCGRISNDLIECERFTANGQTTIRYKGYECCGGGKFKNG